MALGSSLRHGAAPRDVGAAEGVLGAAASGLWRLRRFVVGWGELVDATREEGLLVERGSQLLSELIAVDDWLPAAFAQPGVDRYQQYLLHCDSRERFSVVSFVWGPGQQTPIHDHRVWGLVGVLRGSEWNEPYLRNGLGQLVAAGQRRRLQAGEVSAVSPSLGDLHRVENAEPERVSISIHVYGGNIGAVNRATYDADGKPKAFVSGYANAALPNFWQATGGA